MLFSFRILRVATTVMVMTALAACSKKNDATPTPAPIPEGMSWTVDGKDVTATNAASQASTGTLVILAGATSNSGGVFLEVPKKAGTYALTSTSDASASYLVTPATGNTQSYDATTGNIVVSDVSATSISGTFTFTGTDGSITKTLTNGKFKVKL